MSLPRSFRAVALAATLTAAPPLLYAQQPTVSPAGRPTSDSVVRIQGMEIVGSVSGRGKARVINAVPSDLILSATPGTSALKVVERLPGVNFQSADPWGTYEWANRVTIRGFNRSRSARPSTASRWAT